MTAGGQVFLTMKEEAVTVSDCKNTVDGYEYTFSKEIALAEGDNVVDIKASDATGNEITLSVTISRAASATPTVAPSESPVVMPEIIADGTDTSYTIGSNVSARIHCTGLLEEFVSVDMDGKAIDESNYVVSEGSTLLSMNAAYLDTLSVGEHKVTLHYRDNRSVDFVLNIIQKASTDSGENTDDNNDAEHEQDNVTTVFSSNIRTTPNTGDNSNMTPWLLLLTCSIAIFATKRKTE